MDFGDLANFLVWVSGILVIWWFDFVSCLLTAGVCWFVCLVSCYFVVVLICGMILGLL